MDKIKKKYTIYMRNKTDNEKEIYMELREINMDKISQTKKEIFTSMMNNWRKRCIV